MHGSHENHDMKMMWMMMLACIVPIVLISFGGGQLTGRSLLFIVLGIVIFAIAHIIMMRRGHSRGEATAAKPDGAPPESGGKGPDVHAH